MAKRSPEKRKADDNQTEPEMASPGDEPAADGEDAGSAEEVVLDGSLVCALTGEHLKATPQEETLQSFIEQLHREYGVPLEDMARDFPVACVVEHDGKTKRRTRTVSLVVFEHAKPREQEYVIRVVLLVRPDARKEAKALVPLDEVLGSLSQHRKQVFGLWSNGLDVAFRMRTFHPRTGEPEFQDLADFPAPDESLEDLENADRRPLRIAAGDSLVRTFKRCHDYLYGNQNMRGDRAFWQLLYLIFAKILDERASRRLFFVGATEGNSSAGQKKVAERLTTLFEQVKREFADVFEGGEKLELNPQALTFIAAELGRYSLLSTDTDAKGTAYESITSTTLKRERGQFFTPRNVIQMMVRMANPGLTSRVLDPACGSGGFLVVTLAHVRRTLLLESGCPDPDHPLPSELKRIDAKLRKYAGENLFGIDVDPELRKAARMNMVMNNDGHGNIFSFNSLAFGVTERADEEMQRFKKRSGGEGTFDFVFTNPPFGAKIPVSDQEVLRKFDLGHPWTKAGDSWQRQPEPHRKVAPEILFIERCARFLKPGTGVMAIVMPNGILGNPGAQMEFVRWWMLRELELLASVDLPAETFLPQVSVQASCVFLRRRDRDELRHMDLSGPKQRPVFMAIAEKCGHGRRGETTWQREPNGTERLETREVVERTERDGRRQEVRRLKQLRVLADDMPWVAEQYERFVQGEPIGEA